MFAGLQLTAPTALCQPEQGGCSGYSAPMWLSQLRQSTQMGFWQSHVKHNTLMHCLCVSQEHILSCEARHVHADVLLLLVSQCRQTVSWTVVSQQQHLHPAAKQHQVVTSAHQHQSSVQRQNTEIDSFGHISGGTLQQSQPGPWSKLTGDPATKPRGTEKSNHDATA